MSGMLWFVSGFGCGVTFAVGWLALAIYSVRRSVGGP